MTDPDLIRKDALQKGYDNEALRILELSAKMSELCKFVWAGSLALFFAVLTSAKTDAAYSFYDDTKKFLLAAAICGSLSLLCEYLQFASGYNHAARVVAWIEQKSIVGSPITYTNYNQHTKSALTCMNDAFFVIKNFLAIASAALIAFAVIRFAFV